MAAENADKKLYQDQGKHEQTQGDNVVIFAENDSP